MSRQFTRRLSSACLVAFFAGVVPPSARAQEIGSEFKSSFAAGVRIPSKPAGPVQPSPRWERKKPLEDRSTRKFILMSAAVYAASALDMQESVSLRPHFHEDNPLTRPFSHLPAPAFYASGAAFATAVNFIGWRMARSDRWHRLWWVPQVSSIAGSMSGYVYTKYHERGP